MDIKERFTKIHDTNKWHTQLLTHQKIIAKTVKVTVDNEINRIISPYYLVERKKLSNFAFPNIIAELIHQ